MEELQEKKQEIRAEVADALARISSEKMAEKLGRIEQRLFDFANFMESRIPLLYVALENEVNTDSILKRCLGQGNKVLVLPGFKPEKRRMVFFKVDDPDAELHPGPRGVLEPDPGKCKKVPVDRVDIAVIPALALDEKGGRIGSGQGYYDRLIPDLAPTARKVALALECQIVGQIPMESHDRYVDIIITESRIIYKI